MITADGNFQFAQWRCHLEASPCNIPRLLSRLQLHSDMDKGDGSIRYILTGDGAGTTFTIDDSTGDIHAIQRLDREVKSQYVLRAQARNRQTDRPLEPESEFIVKIQDINDNEPRFLDGPYLATVPEMSKIGEVF